MEKTLIYVFDDFNAAERARAEFVSYGFDPAAVQLSVRDDEAGPVQGNFQVGDAPAAAGSDEYKDAFANPVQRGTCILTITPVDPSQTRYAIALLARYGVIDATVPGHPKPPAQPLHR
ncbi:MAG: hypothetical protein ACJ8LG_13995 [Massilia sp.]